MSDKVVSSLLSAIQTELEELVFLKRQELKLREQELEISKRILRLQELK